MYSQDSFSALCTSSERETSIHPSIKKACSETATLTGAVRISCSLSNSSKPHAREEPNSLLQDSISLEIEDCSDDN